MFEFIEIEENTLDIENGSYINIDNDKIDSNKNYMFLKGSIPIGFYMANYFEDGFFNKDMIKILSKNIPTTQNRADISGKLDPNKMYKSYHKYLTKDTKYNKNNTRTIKNKDCKYSFSNNVKSKVINKDKRAYINNNEYIDRTLKPLIKTINKTTRQYFEIKEDNHIFGIWNELIINKGLRSAIHIDSLNKPDTLSALISLSTDNELETSYLNLVDLDLSIPLKSNKSLLVFPLCNFRHSNNYIDEEKLKNRISLVFYNK